MEVGEGETAEEVYNALAYDGCYNDDIINFYPEKIIVKCYNGNCIIHGENGERWLRIEYTSDDLYGYSPEHQDSEEEACEDYEDYLYNEITDAFPFADKANVEDIIRSIMIYAGDSIARLWVSDDE